LDLSFKALRAGTYWENREKWLQKESKMKAIFNEKWVKMHKKGGLGGPAYGG
jgi:hypothetical protein